VFIKTEGFMEPGTRLDSSKDEDIRNRASAIIAMGKTGDIDALKPLTLILENKDELEWLRACAAIALGRLSGEEVIPPLIDSLHDDSIVVSRAVISALGDVKSDRAIPYLQKILENESKEELHAVTITVLGEIGGCDITPTLLKALESPNNLVGIRAALALGERRTEEAVLPLIKALADSDECLRAAAASALGLIGDNRAIESLIEALDDGAEAVRAIAASSLGCIGDSRAVPPLEKALNDESKTVQKQTAAALVKLRRKDEAVSKNHVI
jgi:HEAT repeat protein